MKRLWTVLQTLNDRSQREDPAPVEASLHQTAAQIQLQVQTKDAFLKPSMGKQGNILLPTPEGLEQRQKATWTWPWEIQAPHMHWVALVACWGQGGGEELANCALGDWDTAPNLAGNTPTASGS